MARPLCGRWRGLKKADKFLPLLDLRTPIIPAQLRNEAGIIGAAVLATQTQQRRQS